MLDVPAQDARYAELLRQANDLACERDRIAAKAAALDALFDQADALIQRNLPLNLERDLWP